MPALVMDWNVPILVQYAACIVITTAVCMVTYDLSVRAGRIGRFLNGRPYPRYSLLASGTVGVLLLGCAAISVTGVNERATELKSWFAKGGALSLLPFEFDSRPFGLKGVKVSGIDLRQCVPVGRYGACGDRVKKKKAVAGCTAMGGRLVSLKTNAERQYVEKNIWKFGAPFWVALTDTKEEGKWVWADGDALAHEPWARGEPNDHGGGEDCAAANWRGSKGWNDLPCGAKAAFLCEFGPQDGEQTTAVPTDRSPVAQETRSTRRRVRH